MEPMPASVLAPRDSWYSSKIEIRRSAIHGRGTFATERIGAGEVVEVWGQRTDGRTTVRYTRDGEAVARARRERRVVMQWDDDLFSIEEKGADDGYFLNHSCDSNLGLKNAFTLVARRDIEPGEELTLDYVLADAFETLEKLDNCSLMKWIHDRRKREPDVPMLYLAARDDSDRGAGDDSIRIAWVEGWSPGTWRVVGAPHWMDEADTPLVADAVREIIDLAN